MSSKASFENLTRYRWMVASRVLLATLGGYLLSSLGTVVLALLFVFFSAPRAEALLTATMWSFVIYAIAALYVFIARTVRRAAMVLSIAALLLVALYAGLRLLMI